MKSQPPSHKHNICDDQCDDQWADQCADQWSESEWFLLQHNFCCICDQALEFDHTIDYEKQITTEKARCTSCKVQLVESTHTLH